LSGSEVRRIQIGAWNINAVVAGAGKPIVLLHGLGMSLKWWLPAVAEFSDEYLVCAVDLPGAGESTGSIVPTRKACRNLVVGVIEALGAGPALVVGHSLGGFVAANAAILDAPGLGGMVLVAPGGFGQIRHPLLRMLSYPVLGDLMIYSGPLGARLFLRSAVFNAAALTPEIWNLADASLRERKVFLDQVRLGMSWGQTTDAYRIGATAQPQVPVQLIWGRHDPVHPVADAYRAERLLGTGPPVIFERSGHLPQIEEPDRFYSTVRASAAGLWPESMHL
jgi:pimeloyl-ACP methyl ester carboxylesterase